MAPDLRFILSERDVPTLLQAEVGLAGYKTIGLFMCMVDSRTELRQMLSDSFHLNPAEMNITAAEAQQRRVNQARMVDAWDTASKRQQEHDRLQAEQRASRLPLTLTRARHIDLRSRYERDHGRLNDRCWPCQSLVERRFEEVDEGEVRADQLTEVVSQEELVEDPIGAVIDKDGAIRLRRAPRNIPLPTSSEELRARVKVLGVTFELAKYQHSSRLWLATSSPQVWQDHLDYVLGDRIGAFLVKLGDQTVRAPWSIVLSYELQVRKTSCRFIMFQGMDLAASMLAARQCLETKEQFFSTPTSLSVSMARQQPAKRLWTETPPPGLALNDTNNYKKRQDKRRGKGKGKGKDTGKDTGKTPGKRAAAFPNTKTPDGRNICFNFQSNNCQVAGCRFVHVCAKCFASHAMVNCTASAGGANQP